MNTNLKMPANFSKIEDSELVNIDGGVSQGWVARLIRAIGGMFGAIDVSGSMGSSTIDSSSISSGTAGVGASATHTEGNNNKVSWSVNGKQFFSSLVDVILTFIH